MEPHQTNIPDSGADGIMQRKSGLVECGVNRVLRVWQFAESVFQVVIHWFLMKRQRETPSLWLYSAKSGHSNGVFSSP